MGHPRRVLVTGSGGLIGSEAAVRFASRGWRVDGVDNDMRRTFFGDEGSVAWNIDGLRRTVAGYTHHDLDIREREAVLALFRATRFDLVIHCAAQPSHDLAAKMPFVDWDVNANGTFNLLEAARQTSPEAPFIFMSTNKVYGDAPNDLPLVELEKRYDDARPADREGVNESCRIDRTLHSLFGASKTAADVAAQEYGRYFGMPVGIFRGGCLTGSRHSGVELHGFLSYLVKCAVRGRPYTIYGYKGKQVRDNIHSEDVLNAFEEFAAKPRAAEVYNLGGGRDNSVSVLEAIDRLKVLTGRELAVRYDDQARRGDHICYISDLRKLGAHFPAWRITRTLDSILAEMVASELARV